MSKVLLLASTHKHIKGFHIPYIQMLQSWGYEVHVAANDGDISVPEADRQIVFPIERNPFSFQNLQAIDELKHLIKKEGYKLIHCHTAMGSVVARVAAREFRKYGLKLLYTAHGFHFFKGSPAYYWWLYYPVEKYLSRYTDGLILINREDYELVNKRNFKQNESYLIPGMGVQADRFYPVSKQIKTQYRKENRLSPNDFILVYAAEYIERKDHNFVLDNAQELKNRIPNIKILFAGRGRLFEKIKKRIEKNQIQDYVIQLGFRKDIDKIYQMSDVGISCSRQEGLPMNITEEMFTGLPIVGTKIRGNRDLIEDGENGFLFSLGDSDSFVNYIYRLHQDDLMYRSMSNAAVVRAQKFEISNSMREMEKIYRNYL